MDLFSWLLARRRDQEDCGGSSETQYVWNIRSCPANFANNPTFSMPMDTDNGTIALQYIKIGEPLGNVNFAVIGADFLITNAADGTKTQACAACTMITIESESDGDVISAWATLTWDDHTVYIMISSFNANAESYGVPEIGTYICITDLAQSYLPDSLPWVFLWA